MPSLAALRAFDCVARARSYAAAATVLNVTEAALRQHVRRLENQIGQPLVERSGRGIVLTQAGEILAETTREGFDTLKAGVASLTADEDRRPLRIALPPSFAETWLMPRLGDFWAHHPEINLELVPSLKIVDLRADRFDMAIRYGEGEWPGVTCTRLAPADYLVVARPDVAGATPARTAADLADRCWLFERDRVEHRRWSAAHGIDFDAPHHRHFPTNSLVLSALHAGQGLSLQARALVQGDIDTGRLAILFDDPASHLAYYIVTRGDPRLPLRRFIAWLKRAA
ncbi:LysR substrate-binding domain-containing protein [Stappia sp.]|uniref:LysR substrate-binding domain-containing protein n=1 Tax=Stappia sp. TaxID=1870903 RepID=UPI0032D8BFA6